MCQYTAVTLIFKNIFLLKSDLFKSGGIYFHFRFNFGVKLMIILFI